MNKLRIFTIIADVLLIIGMGLAIAVQSAGNLLALAFLPWLAWPYLMAIQVWWTSKMKMTQISLALFIAICAIIQASIYFQVFVWHVDTQSTFSWFLSPMYCLFATVLLIPYVIERRKNKSIGSSSVAKTVDPDHG